MSNQNSSHRPLIGIAPRIRTHTPTAEVPEHISPEWCIASMFDEAIVAAGGIPVVLPLTDDEDVLDECVERFDGFALPGGSDVNPALWGETGYDPALLCPERDTFEIALVKRVLAADKPLFATCRGMQLLNVAQGGSLCMDVPSLGAPRGMTQWRHTMVLMTPSHPVVVDKGTKLFDIVGHDGMIQVNSAHHCCVDRLGEGLRLTAHATDGIPEALEMLDKRFVVGVQWHPEYTWNMLDSDMNLWRAFVQASSSPDVSKA